MSIPLARKQLWHNKDKLILHVMGIAATIALIILLFGLREGMYTSVTAYIRNVDVDLVIVQTGNRELLTASSSLPASDHSEIERISDAETAHVLIGDIIFTHAEHKTPVLLIGYNLQKGTGGPWNIADGRAVERDGEMLLDIWLANRSDIEVGDEIVVLGDTFRIVGLTRETSSWMSPYVFVSQSDAERLLQLPGGASFYLLRLNDSADLEATRSAIEASIEGVEVLEPEAVAAADRKILSTVFETPITVIITIGFGIGVLVMGLIVHIGIHEQMQEYGVLKAVGASGPWLRRLVFTETLYRAGLGFLIGVGLAYGVGQLIMRFLPQFTIAIRPESVGIVATATLMMAVLATVLPLRNVLRLDPNVVFSQ